jgi:hypothetical protein
MPFYGAGSKLRWGEPVEARVRPRGVVVLAAILHLFPGIRKAQEPMRVQALGSEATVEGLDECIIGRLARPREVKRNAPLVGPQIQIARHKQTRCLSRP